ncbi:MAG TPA: VIT1/CCC1 transporter family protein [Gemmatimonadaceae bacterium]|jgi:VIT1/CCC1 family predicted Fe2+/Mn2+ transporter|nr:VIT1/CCC1 transporter family protein [Gemmatimonadaceae bacterium]
MSSASAPAPAPTASAPDPTPDLEAFREHWQDEADAAHLYRILAGFEPDAEKKRIYLELAGVEDRHTKIWAALLAEHGQPVGKFRPTGRTRLLAFLGRWLGPGFLLPMLLAEEGREVRQYLNMHRGTATGAPGWDEALLLARESAEHATTLGTISGRKGEPWHRTESGGFLRNVVYGFNDGLTANFGLVAGVIGASVTGEAHAVIVAGVAGLIADSLSMGASGYLAAKSEQEVYAYEIAMERDEIALMPEVERDELSLIYQAKGMRADAAHALATEVMRDPARMLNEQVQEELGIGDPHMSPLREGWVTGAATAVGALIPVAPFLFWTGNTAIILAFSISMFSHWLVGAARSIFTGRSVFRSGLDMFVVGLGVAGVGYVVGDWISRLL